MSWPAVVIHEISIVHFSRGYSKGRPSRTSNENNQTGLSRTRWLSIKCYNLMLDFLEGEVLR
jgi:hypothetical protein